MKKTLVITLALVMAFASSAMAAVNFGGSFEAVVENDSFTKANIELKNDFKLTVKASSSEADWSFDAEVGSLLSTPKLGKYLLKLNDNYFDLYFWGNGRELSNKGTALGFLQAGKAASKNRARLVVPVMDLADVTVDFQPGTLYTFADLDIAGYEAGLGYKRASSTDTIVGWGKAGLDLADTAVNVEGTIGMTLVDTPEDPEAEKPSGLAYGAKVSSDVIDGLNVWAKFVGAGDGWKGDTIKAGKQVVSAGAKYTETELEVSGDVEQTIDGDNKVNLGAKYRFSDKVGFGDLFKGDKYFNNDAPAAGLSASLTEFKLGSVTLNVASPVLEDFIWAKAFGTYGNFEYANETEQDVNEDGSLKFDDDGKEVWVKEKENGFKVGLDAYIKATDKLTVEPFAAFESIGNVITVGSKADYKIGASDTKLGLEVKKVMADDIRESLNSELIKASVKVTF